MPCDQLTERRMGVVKLSEGQTIRVYGLLPVSSVLDWDTVRRLSLQFKWLHDKLKLTSRQLHNLQPDVDAWVAAGLVDIGDCAHMTAWPLNPLVHLKTPVDKLISHGADSLRKYGVTFAQMRQAGLSYDMMQLFHFSLLEWQTLGFALVHAQHLSDTQARLLFGMSAADTVLGCTAEQAQHEPVVI